MLPWLKARHPEGKDRFSFIRKQQVGHPDCPIMLRTILSFPGFSLRLHRFFPDKEDYVAHSHPWWFITLVIRGDYTDITTVDGVETQRQHMSFGSVKFRSASHAHRTKVGPNGCTTFVITGPLKPDWGFWVKGKFMKFDSYRQSPHARVACDPHANR